MLRLKDQLLTVGSNSGLLRRTQIFNFVHEMEVEGGPLFGLPNTTDKVSRSYYENLKNDMVLTIGKITPLIHINDMMVTSSFYPRIDKTLNMYPLDNPEETIDRVSANMYEINKLLSELITQKRDFDHFCTNNICKSYLASIITNIQSIVDDYRTATNLVDGILHGQFEEGERADYKQEVDIFFKGFADVILMTFLETQYYGFDKFGPKK